MVNCKSVTLRDRYVLYPHVSGALVRLELHMYVCITITHIDYVTIQTPNINPLVFVYLTSKVDE